LAKIIERTVKDIGLVETQYFTFGNPPDELILESGEKLGPVTLAYETYGTLNKDKSNAILDSACPYRKRPCCRFSS
jgi:homoserine O-acetyltransferase